MKQRYGALTIDVPDGLVDESLVILRAPTPAPAVRMRVPAREPLRPSFVVKRIPLAPGSDEPAPRLEDIGAAEERMLAQTVDGFTVHSRDLRTVGAGRALLVVELSFDAPDGKLRQVHATCAVGRTVLVFVCTALDDASFAGIRDQLLAMAATASFE